MPAPPWAEAPVIADTPDTRAALLAAYRDLHATLQAGDHARVQAAYGTTWQHIARSMYGWSMETFIARTRPFAALAPDGLTLQPLDLVLGPDRFRIERMAGGRLLRIVPDPIVWRVHPGAEDVTTTKVAFFQGPDGRLQVGAVLF
jgi:hypothetical protein